MVMVVEGLAETEDLRRTDLLEGMDDLARYLCVDEACRWAASRAVTGSLTLNTRIAIYAKNQACRLNQVTVFTRFHIFDPRSLIRGCVNFGSGAVSGCEPLRFYPPPIPTTLTRAEERRAA